MKKQEPHEIHSGNMKAKIWANEGIDGKIFFRTSFVRSYKNEKGESAESTLLSIHDLPKLEIVTRKAYEFMLTLQDINNEDIGTIASFR
jgi:hypothetical protein